MKDKEFYEQLKKLNAIHNSFFSWSSTTAKKDHLDEFGGEIKRGEEYYRRNVGSGWGDDFRVSRKSMEKHLEILFYMNNELEELAGQTLKQQEQQFMGSVEMSNKDREEQTSTE
jgi:hypothetical protein